MARNYSDQNTIRQYLLGELDSNEQQGIEMRLLAEDDLLEELEITEDELIDEYLADKLSGHDREKFEQNFLATPERQQKVRFSRSLRRYVRANQSQEDSTSSRSPFWPIHNRALSAAFAVAVIVILGGIFWSLRYPSSSPTYATLNLVRSTSNRAEPTQVAKITLPLNADKLRLRMALPETAEPGARHRVELLKENRETQALSAIGQDEKSVTAEIPAAQLSRGQYALNLYVIKPDGTEQRIRGSYFFTVE